MLLMEAGTSLSDLPCIETGTAWQAELAGGLAHDLARPVGAVQWFCRFLRERRASKGSFVNA